MDLAIELEQEFEVENYTTTNSSKAFYDGLYPHQIAGLAFSLFCLAPNVFLLYIICKHRLSSTIYWTITNWTLLNALLIINFLPLHIVPGNLITLIALELITAFSIILLIFTGTLLTLFMFDFFIKSEKICKYLTIVIWVLIICWDVFTVVTSSGEMHMPAVSLTLEIFFILIVLIFALRVIYCCFKPSNEVTYRLRLRLCCTYLTSLFLIWATDFMAYLHHFYVFVTIIAVIIIYLDGYINLIVLIYFDPKIKRHFLQIFCASDKYVDIKFDTQNSVIDVIDQSQ